VLPLSLFDDFKTESELLKEMMEDRRSRNKKQLAIIGLQQDNFGDETLISGTCLDYLPELERFIVDFNGFRYLSNRLRLTFDYFETVEDGISRRKAAY
jgi:hypothetical protein